ncbi:MAG TPA: ROK family protein [Ilumatobacteraceae bacterium]
MGTADQLSSRSAASSKAAPADARPRNRTLLLQALHSSGPQSRADLARHSGLTATTVSAVTAELIADGLIAEVGRKASTSAGKPATLLGVEPDARHVVALDLSDDDVIEAAVVNLAGKIVARHSHGRNGDTGKKAAQAIVRFTRDIARTLDRPLLGVGCATPGIVDDHGVVLTAAHAKWSDEPLAAKLTAAIDVPCYVANDANAAVLAEYGALENPTENLLLVRVGGGVGAGVVIGGELFVGDHFAAGEIGHVVVDDEGALCKCGRRGCLEAIVSAPLLAQRLNGVRHSDRASHLELAGRHLGIVLATLVGALNLSQIVLSGPMDLLDDRFRLAAIDTIRNRTFPTVGQNVTVRFSSLGDDGVLLGAAALVLRNELGIV